MGATRARVIPCTRTVERALRRNRLLAARCYAIHSMPRFAILLGLWDGGEIVSSAGAALQKEKVIEPGRGKQDRRKDRGAKKRRDGRKRRKV